MLLFKPVKRMVKERQEKVKKIEQENSDLNEEVKKTEKQYGELFFRKLKKQAAVIHENAVKVADQKADEIVADAKRREAKALD